MTRTILLAALSFGVGLSHPQDLRDQVRSRGSVELHLIRDYPPVDFKTLVRGADLIARVLITESKASLLGEEVVTDYKVQVLAVAKGSQNVERTIITVRKPGGIVAVDGGTISARDPEFPPFAVAEEYVVFLKATTSGYFEVRFGGQGAFKVEQGKVAQTSDIGNWNREHGRADLRELLKEIDASSKNP